MASQQLGLFAPPSLPERVGVDRPSHEPAPGDVSDSSLRRRTSIRILFLADSHLGFDLPTRPRTERRRRGHDFFSNYLEALKPALDGKVDLVVHGGDVFHRPKVPFTVAHQAFEPLREIAESGIPVFVVPGNHERGCIPHALSIADTGIHVFDHPRTFRVDVGGTRIGLGGFPYERREVRGKFPGLLRRTGLFEKHADLRLLCVHHCIEGATVGPSDYVFRYNADVIRGRDLPAGVAAVLSGHIHRHQVLTADLGGRPFPAPVLYPGSVERTSFAEKDEPKGYMILELDASPAGGAHGPGGSAAGDGYPSSDNAAVASDGYPSSDGPAPADGCSDGRGSLKRWTFRELPARPMVEKRIDAAGMTAEAIETTLRRGFADLHTDAIVKLRVAGHLAGDAAEALAASRLRAMAPDTMNVDAVFEDGSGWRGRRRRTSNAPAKPRAEAPLPGRRDDGA